MSVKRFLGTNSRDAMRMVRAVLGDDALILTNRQTEEGVEILAVAEGGVADQAATDRARQSAPVSVPRTSRPALLQSGATRAALDLPSLGGHTAAPGRRTGEASMSERLLREMQEMRELLSLERQRRGPGSGIEQQLRELLGGAGFSATLADELLGALPTELMAPATPSEVALGWLHRQLFARLRMLENEDEFLDQGGVIALVGPTGVGKTTTAAKLAARFVMKYGPEQVALVSTDSYRVGAHEQLRIYARLLGVPMYALDIEQSITELGPELWQRRFVIVDTVGTSQRDQRAVEQIVRLRQADSAVRLILLLNAASQPETLREVISVYQSAAHAGGAALQDCIISKIDECGQLGPCLEEVLSSNLRVLFASQGQRVPEDLVCGGKASLVETALAAPSDPVQAATANVLNPAPQWTRNVLGQARRIPRILGGLRRHLPGFRDLEDAWRLTLLPAGLQVEQLDRLLADLDRQLPALGILWQRRGAVTGADWAMPDLMLSPDNGWVPLPLLQHRQPAGLAEKFAWAEDRLGVREHLLAALPDMAGWDWLAQRKSPWMAAVRGTQKVFHCSVRQELSHLQVQAKPVSQRSTHYRGRPASLSLARLSVTAAPVGRRSPSDSYPVTAWFAEWHAADTGLSLARRFWLSMEIADERIADLLEVQMQTDTLSTLTRKARESLHSLHQGEVKGELLLLLASGLAATALSLEQARGEWAMDLRADLLGVLGGRHRATAPKLLQSLLCLASVRDGLRHLDAADISGVA